MATKLVTEASCRSLAARSNASPYSNVRNSWSSAQRRSQKLLNSYYEDILKQRGSAPSVTAPSQPRTAREENLERARIVFGSRLAGPADRRRELERASTQVAGVLVPPRPDEPDNCCMSGCVNCVWDLFRDELEEWAAKSAEAREALQSQKVKEPTIKDSTRIRAPMSLAQEASSSMDDDGGGSESLWSGDEDGSLLAVGGSDLFADIPVGIREFMRTEKLLKEQKWKQKQ